MARSKFESDLKRRLKGCKYEPFTVSYTWESEYCPDFVPNIDQDILIEAKGRFRTRQESRKYEAVRKCNPSLEIVFVFMNPNVPMPGARKRKDGSKLTHKEWAELNNFRWFTLGTLPEEWRKK